jgi:Nucleotidyl transferase AbiEii toxin, Type IV TA system
MHLSILSETQKQLLPFVKTLRKEYYLVGGTAIALYIGHRMSIDFDLFKKSNVHRAKLNKVLLAANIGFQLIFADTESFHILASGIRLPSLLDLAAMKAYALGRRAKWKDYVDLYFILRDFYTLQEIIERTQILFEGVFSPKLFRQQLCYFEDIDYTEEVSFLDGFAVQDAEIKAFLTNIALMSL